MSKTRSAPTILPIVVIFGDEEYQKSVALTQALDELLPPPIDRGLALCDYDGSRTEEQGGPSLAGVMDDLNTLPFLTDRRAVVVRDADKFISATRERLENYLKSPSQTATLILMCRSFPRTLRLSKAADAAGGRLIECKKLTGRALIDFAAGEAKRLGKQLSPAAAARLVDQVGGDQGIIATEVEKLAVYATDRSAITEADIAELVGQSREERIFAVMDVAALGQAREALTLWRQVLASDPAAVFKVLGGMAYVVRRWMAAAQMVQEGMPVHAVAPKVMMYGRANELEQILRRYPLRRLGAVLAELADLDGQVKTGARSMEMGVEALLVRLAS